MLKKPFSQTKKLPTERVFKKGCEAKKMQKVILVGAEKRSTKKIKIA